MKKPSIFDVDKKGLAKLIERRGIAFVGYELVQNALDTNAKTIDIELTTWVGVPKKTQLRVFDDDPDGFHDLSHAYTLFAESEKKGDPTKRGIFNLGEKLVIAYADEARIVSTKGSVEFTKDGRKESKSGQAYGTTFTGTFSWTRAQTEELRSALQLLLPGGRRIRIDGEQIPERTPVHTFEATLATMIGDEEGIVRKTARKTEVRIYENWDGISRLYEMGIPVVETDLPWTVEVMQKVPLNMERDNVTPAYARDLAALVVNAIHDRLKPEQAALPSIQATLADPNATKEAKDAIMTQTWGEKRALQDLKDPEADDRLKSQGYNIIPINVLPKGAAKQLRENNLIILSGTLSPTPHAYGAEGAPADFIPEDEWTSGMKKLAEYTHGLGWKLLKKSINVRFERGRMTSGWGANYIKGLDSALQRSTLTFNFDRLGRKWFDGKITEDHDDLIIHEFGHEYESNHLNEAYHNALTRLAAKLKGIALAEPGFFRPFLIAAGEPL